MHVRSLFRATASAAFVALALPFASAQHFEVPTHYPTIQAAIDAAPSGASITVLPGQYAPFEIVGKSLSIHGAGAAHVHVGPGAPAEIGVSVRDLPAGGEVLISGMTVSARGMNEIFVFEIIPMVRVRDCAGTVIFSGVENGTGPEIVWVNAGILVEASALVVVDSSVFRGGPYPSASEGIRAIGSGVWISNSEVRGGHVASAPPGGFCFGAPGRAGIDAAGGSSLYVAASVVRGGNGGSAPFGCGIGPGGSYGGPGGPAVRVVDSVAKFVSGELLAGSPGGGITCPGAGGSAVVATGSSALVADRVTLVPTGSTCQTTFTMAPALSGDVFHHESRPSPTLAVSPTPAQPGSTLTIRMEGDAGALAVLAVGSLAGPAVVLPPIDGATVLAFSPLVLVQPFVLDGTGAAEVQVQLPAKPAFAGASFPAQTIVFSGSDAAFSNPVVIAGAP